MIVIRQILVFIMVLILPLSVWSLQIQYLGQINVLLEANQVAAHYQYDSLQQGDSGRYWLASLGSQAKSRDIYVPVSVNVVDHKLVRNSMSFPRTTLSFPRRRESSQNIDCPLGRLCARVLGNGDLTVFHYHYNAKTNPYQSLDQQSVYRPVAPNSHIYQELSQTNYHYNLNDKLILLTLWNENHAIQTQNHYDALGRLVLSAQPNAASHYRYDANGNMLSQSGSQALVESYTGLDQAQTMNAQSKGYDSNGNQQYSMSGNLYQFNARNQLVSCSASLNRYHYDYYANGLRATKQAKGTALYFYYGGTDLLNTVAGIGQQTADYLLADGRLYRGVQQTNQQVSGHYELLTHQGNVSGHLTQQQGQLTEMQAYSAYGGIMRHLSSAAVTAGMGIQSDPFGYDSEYQDAETGLIYLDARYYSPSSLRFISQDSYPLINRYNYVRDDPFDRVDPGGHMSESGTRRLEFGTAFAALLFSFLPTAGVSTEVGFLGLSGVMFNFSGALDWFSAIMFNQAFNPHPQYERDVMWSAANGLAFVPESGFIWFPERLQERFITELAAGSSGWALPGLGVTTAFKALSRAFVFEYSADTIFAMMRHHFKQILTANFRFQGLRDSLNYAAVTALYDLSFSGLHYAVEKSTLSESRVNTGSTRTTLVSAHSENHQDYFDDFSGDNASRQSKLKRLLNYKIKLNIPLEGVVQNIYYPVFNTLEMRYVAPLEDRSLRS